MTPYTDHSLLLDRLKWQLQRARTASYDRPRTAEQKQARAAYMRKWAKAHPDYRRKKVVDGRGTATQIDRA